jgi:NTP pyrophosphatase (non-canonical NTP hydrolase)
MQLNEYQEKAATTSGNIAVGGNTWLYPVLGLAGETGETVEKFKKIFRDNEGVLTDEKKEEIIKELGDVLWYLAEISRQIHVPFEVIAQTNLDKLASRKERGMIQGSGDNR